MPRAVITYRGPTLSAWEKNFLKRHKIRHNFNPKILQEANRVEPDANIFKNRLGVLGIAIDRPGTRERDDAIWVEKTSYGYAAQVHIADVSELVPAGSLIDIEARERGIVQRDAVSQVEAGAAVLDINVGTASVCALAITERVTRELGLNTISGASNVSFGLPGRHDLNAAFLAMMIAKGLNAAITNPLHQEIATTAQATNLLMMRDDHAGEWIAAQRAKTGES